jgi:ribonuclease P protein component
MRESGLQASGLAMNHDRQALLQRRTPMSYPRQSRVRARVEFDRVFKEGKRTASPLMALHVLPDAVEAPTCPRLGLAVSRKVDGRAVGRNRIKRALREQFRSEQVRLKPGAYVIVARPGAAQSDNTALRNMLLALFTRAGALLPAGMDGTMPPAPLPSTPAAPERGE